MYRWVSAAGRGADGVTVLRVSGVLMVGGGALFGGGRSWRWRGGRGLAIIALKA